MRPEVKEAMCKEFGFLERYLPSLQPNDDLLDIKVELADCDLLGQKATFYNCGDVIVPIDVRIFLLDKTGQEIKALPRAGKWPKYPDAPWWSRKTLKMEESNGETIEQALQNLGERAKEVFYVLELKASRYWGWDISIHRPPKKFNLPDWLVEKKIRADQELAETIAKIDAIGEE